MKKVCIIEDEVNLSEMYKILFEQEGYEVRCAFDGESGLKLIEEYKPDLVLLDIMLPKKDGLAVLKELSDDRKKKVGQIVMLTNLGQEAVVQEGFTLGAVGHLVKSALAPDQVLTEVSRFLAHEQS